jgi:hypothetical protein
MAYKIQDVIASAYGLVSVSAGGPGSGRHKDGLTEKEKNTQVRSAKHINKVLERLGYSERIGYKPGSGHVFWHSGKADGFYEAGLGIAKPNHLKVGDYIADLEYRLRNDRNVGTHYLKSAAYKLARKTEFQGLPISIETDKGQIRKGVGKDGRPWKIRMPWPYGYIRLTQGTDKDHIDCFIGPNADAKNVYVTHQNKEDAKKYDEDKVMLGFDSADQALAAYKSAYTGVNLFRSMSVLSVKEFKRKISKTKDLKRPHKIHAGGPGSGRKPLYHLTDIKNLKSILKNGIRTENTGGNAERKGWDRSGNAVYAFENKNHSADVKWSLQNSLNPNNKFLLGNKLVAVEFIPAGKVKRDEEYDDYYVNSTETLSARIHKGPVPAENVTGYYEVKKSGAIDEKSYKRLRDVQAFVDYDGDYFEYNEKMGAQPIVPAHPPSLKNPIKVKVNNPDDEDTMYKSKKMKKRLAKDIAERTRTGAAKPEIVQTTLFVPMSQG